MRITQNAALTGISTCAVGIFSVLIWVLIFPSTSSRPVVLTAESMPVISSVAQETSIPNLKEEIEIRFEGITEIPVQISETERRTDKTAKFIVTNRLQEWLYFTGYGGEDTCGYALYKEGNKLYQESCWCGTGLDERMLWSKDSQVFQVYIPDNAEGVFRAEFDFKIGKKRRKETISIDFAVPVKTKD